MPSPKFEIVPFNEGYVIDVKWSDGTVERTPGLFTSELAAEECLASDSFQRLVAVSPRSPKLEP
jgi:hypothetical protein